MWISLGLLALLIAVIFGLKAIQKLRTRKRYNKATKCEIDGALAQLDEKLTSIHLKTFPTGQENGYTTYCLACESYNRAQGMMCFYNSSGDRIKIVVGEVIKQELKIINRLIDQAEKERQASLSAEE